MQAGQVLECGLFIRWPGARDALCAVACCGPDRARERPSALEEAIREMASLPAMQIGTSGWWGIGEGRRAGPQWGEARSCTQGAGASALPRSAVILAIVVFVSRHRLRRCPSKIVREGE